MTFEEWWNSTGLDVGFEDCVRSAARDAWEAAYSHGVNVGMEHMTVPAGSTVVSVKELQHIEDALAFELGGEPYDLTEAHTLVKSMLDNAQVTELLK